MLRVYKAFTKTGSLAKRRLCLGPAGVIKLHSTICIVLLSEFVSQNTWLQQLHFSSYPLQDFLFADFLVMAILT